MNCIFCDSFWVLPLDGTIGIVSLEAEGSWRSESEREVFEYFHSSCWERELDFRFGAGTYTCSFCNESVIIASGDIIVGIDYGALVRRKCFWFHRKCWDLHGIVLE